MSLAQQRSVSNKGTEVVRANCSQIAPLPQPNARCKQHVSSGRTLRVGKIPPKTIQRVPRAYTDASNRPCLPTLPTRAAAANTR